MITNIYNDKLLELLNKIENNEKLVRTQSRLSTFFYIDCKNPDEI